MSTFLISRRHFIFAALSSVASALFAASTGPEPIAAAGDKTDEFMAGKGFARYRQETGHRIYICGKGPAVLIFHELPGLYKEDIDLALHVAKCGFTAVVPVFFGTPGHEQSTRNFFLECLVPFTQFHCWLPGVTTRAAHWLVKLVPYLHDECGGKGVGLIGMCLTGSLPLALLKEPKIKAAVLCQPTNPLIWKHSLDISKDDLQAAIDRKDVVILGVKFSGDGKSPHQRFETLRKKLKGHFSELIIDSGREGAVLGNAQHSVLGMHYNQTPTSKATREALDRIIRYLNERLSDPSTLLPYPGSHPDSLTECPRDKFTSCASY